MTALAYLMVKKHVHKPRVVLITLLLAFPDNVKTKSLFSMMKALVKAFLIITVLFIFVSKVMEIVQKSL